jgi:hypothetical protein
MLAGNGAPLIVGADAGSLGMVVQTGGMASIDGEVHIGGTAGATGTYTLSGGTLTTAADGAGALLIGRSGGSGTLIVEGDGNFIHNAEAFVGNLTNSGAVGRLEIIGSAASVQVGQLENAPGGAAGVSETIRWKADAGGVTPLVITGAGFLSANRVQLQDPAEEGANTGVDAMLQGDGIALELDLSAFTASATLTLIDNQTPDAVTGFFERGNSLDLYEEGATISGTGYSGSVNISYVGGTGNDVVLSMVASPAESADFDSDGDVDGSDFLTWQRGLGINNGASRDQGDADADGAVTAADLKIWNNGFEAPGIGAPVGTIPEPHTLLLSLAAISLAAPLCRLRSKRL